MPQRLSTTAFAKSTRPELGAAVQRESLFIRMDGSAARTVVWISAPPGFGKTTLAASYLEARRFRWAWYQLDQDDEDGETFFHYLAHAVGKLQPEGATLPVFGPEHRANLSAFSRRFFRAVFAGPRGPRALVLDNINDLSSESPLRTILEAGLPEVPTHGCLVVTCRTPPPVRLTRLQASGQMVCIDADALRITAPELGTMAQLRGKSLDGGRTAQLLERADGWAAALVLMLERDKLSDAQSQLSADATPKVVFDYLAGEIFERFDASTQRLLLLVACLPRVTIEIARSLSGDKMAGPALLNLAHNDYFVKELLGADGRVFIFHPLLKEFLLHRAARDLPEAIGVDALRRAATLLRDSGQPEDALMLFVQSRSWADAAAVTAEQADMLLAQGRHATLAGWLELLPPELVANDAVLLLAHGQALGHASPRAARRRFEAAFAAFERGGDHVGMARSCVGVIDTMLREFDDLAAMDAWLVRYDQCRAASADAGGPMPAVVLSARLWRDAGHPGAIPSAPFRDDGDRVGSELVRSNTASLNGDVARAAAIDSGIDARGGESRLAIAASQALRELIDGEAARAHASAQAGLALAADEAIHGYDAWLRMLCVAADLARDDTEAARAELELVGALPLRRGDLAFVHYLRALLARATGQPGDALREARNAALVGGESGLPWPEGLARITMAQLLAADRDRSATEAQLRLAESLAERLNNPLLRLATRITQAGCAISFGDDAASIAPLQSGLGLARELGVRRVVGVPAEMLGNVCAAALKHGIAVEQTRLLISTGRLAPPPGGLRLRRWPWAFEVTTLGSFDLRRGGEPVEFSAKGPGRPVELLKVLIALGGQNVRADQLADALWPRVDADYAHKSFTATLHRLRRIFDEDDSLKLRDGRLSLNAALFWIDGWAIEQVFAAIDDALREPSTRATDQALLAMLDDALALYKGPFLSDDAEQPAYIARREQLRARLLRAVSRIARRWEEDGRIDAAIDCYLRCIDVDEQCEALYRNLMLCCQRRGDLSEAMSTYERLRAVLAARSKSEPTAETRAIYDSLRP
ncbi:MAG: BTAD domain-containing putative transcriptional regulator [Caldimonas sp.]